LQNTSDFDSQRDPEDWERGGASIEFVPRSTVLTSSGILRALARRKVLAASVLLSVLILAAAYILTIPKKYEAELRLFVTRSRVDAPVSASGGAVGSVASDLSDAEVNSELELLKTPQLIDRAALEAGLFEDDATFNPVKHATALKKILADFQADVLKKTNIIVVQYAGSDPGKSQKFVNMAAELFLEKHAELHRNGETSDFFRQKSSEYKSELARAQIDLANFERTTGVAAMDTQRESATHRRDELQTQLNDAASQLHEAEDRARVLASQLAGLPASIDSENRIARNETLVEHLKTLLLELNRKRSELLTKYDPRYRLVQEVDQEIQETKAALDRELAPGVVDRVSTPNPLRQTVQGELLQNETLVAGLKAKQQNILANLSTQMGTQRDLAQATPLYEDLKRKAKIAEENYLLYRGKEENARIGEQMDQQRILNVSVMEPAKVPALPMDRHRSFIALLALLTGLVLAVFSAVGIDLFDQPIETPRQAAATAGVPVLARLGRGA
jgi:uncharacterized protein involved in exopolysaccharide biosynthesis